MTKEEYIKYVEGNELRNRVPDIYDIEDAWVAGYNAAVEKANEWIAAWCIHSDLFNESTNCYVGQEDINEFKKHMEL